MRQRQLVHCLVTAPHDVSESAAVVQRKWLGGLGILAEPHTCMCCTAAAAIAKSLAIAAVAPTPLVALAAATVTVVATLAAAAATATLRQGMSRAIPDGKHSDHQLMYSMVQLAGELEGDAGSGGAGSVGSDVLAFKAHEAPQQILQHCTAGDACVRL